jgi:hypothetical protein
MFDVDRGCYLGSIDDWFHLETGTLPDVAGKFIQHVGVESFSDLM